MKLPPVHSDRRGNSLKALLAAGAITVAISFLSPVVVIAQSPQEVVIYIFQNSDGAFPEAGLVQGSDGNLYGVTAGGGGPARGTAFVITTSGALASLHTFTGADGVSPLWRLAEGTAGNFYGTTALLSSDPTNAYPFGSVFQVSSSGAFATLHGFSGGSDGDGPEGGLVLGPDANLYGSTGGGGSSGLGEIFKIAPDGTLTTLHSFSGPDGVGPYGNLALGADGSIYGATVSGGANNEGTVFRMASDGTFTTLYSFALGTPRAIIPANGVVLARDGNLYGTASNGGTAADQAVFRVAPTGGGFTVLGEVYAGAGSTTVQCSISGLIQGSDGNFYGTTFRGGDYSLGSVFQLTPSGSVSTVHSFQGGNTDGEFPCGGVIQAKDGNLYGTTVNGGPAGGPGFPNGFGTVFKIVMPTQGSALLDDGSGGTTFQPQPSTTSNKSGAAEPNQCSVQSLRVRCLDQSQMPVPNCTISLQLTADTTDVGGHVQAFHTTAHPLGNLLPLTSGALPPNASNCPVAGSANGQYVFTTPVGPGADQGTALLLYYAPEASGSAMISGVAAASGFSASIAPASIHVGIPNLQPLSASPGVLQLTGPTNPHPSNHYGTTSLVAILTDIATQYDATIRQPNSLQYPFAANDESLIEGGLFDLDGSYDRTSGHALHRLGHSADVGSGIPGAPFQVAVPPNVRMALYQLVAASGLRPINEGIGCYPIPTPAVTCTHWHLQY